MTNRMIGTTAAVRVCCTLLALALAIAPVACKKKKVRVGATDEETPKIMSSIGMGDPKAEPQLVKGFHGIEAGAWRWTEKQFTAVLRCPMGAAQKGGKLTFKLTVPEPTIKQLKTVSLSANAAGNMLAPETYTVAGDYVYVRDIPAGALTGETVRIDFELDKAMPPAGSDSRQLGIIALNLALESK
jgi:hypothetical protein